MTAEGSIRSPLDPRCAGQPFVPSVARGVGRNASGSTHDRVGPGDRAGPPSRPRRHRRGRDESERTGCPLTVRAR